MNLQHNGIQQQSEPQGVEMQHGAATPGVVQPTAPVPQPPPGFVPVEVVEKARQEEKEKLYSDLQRQKELVERLRKQVEEIEAERRASEEEEARIRAEKEEAERRAREEEMTVRQLLQQREQEWKAQLEQIRAESEARVAALEKEREYAALQSLIQKRAREEVEAGRIAPELVDLIDGNSPEAVERSIEMLRAKTEQIAQNMAAQVVAAQPPIRGVSPAGYAPVGPMENNPQTQMVTPEAIRSMDMKEYAVFRQKYFGNRSNSGNGVGLFG